MLLLPPITEVLRPFPKTPCFFPDKSFYLKKIKLPLSFRHLSHSSLYHFLRLRINKMGIFLSNDGVKTFSTQKPKLLDQDRQALRTKHYSKRTEEAYVHWIHRFINYHNKRHPKDMGEIAFRHVRHPAVGVMQRRYMALSRMPNRPDGPGENIAAHHRASPLALEIKINRLVGNDMIKEQQPGKQDTYVLFVICMMNKQNQ